MPDKQILAGGTEPAPLEYTVPNAQTILLKAVAAEIDGSGASGPFIPAVVIESDGGVVIARAADPSVVIAAGSSCEVSWFPGVNRGGSGGTAAAFKYLHVVAGGVAPPVNPLTIVTFETNDPANYVQTDASHWTIPAVPQQMEMLLLSSGTVTTNGTINGNVQNNGGFNNSIRLGTGVLTDGVSQVWFLQSGFELAPTWHAWLAGGETHTWGIHAWFFYVG